MVAKTTHIDAVVTGTTLCLPKDNIARIRFINSEQDQPHPPSGWGRDPLGEGLPGGCGSASSICRGLGSAHAGIFPLFAPEVGGLMRS